MRNGIGLFLQALMLSTAAILWTACGGGRRRLWFTVHRIAHDWYRLSRIQQGRAITMVVSVDLNQRDKDGIRFSPSSPCQG